MVAGCAPAPQPRWHEAVAASPRPLAWDVDVFLLDPLATSAADVSDLHRSSKRVVCQVSPAKAGDPDFGHADVLVDRLKLCRDKGFDGVSFASPSALLRQQASDLGLPVIQR